MPEELSLYRYTHRRWAEELTQLGKIKLGTLHKYQREEKHAPGVGDRDEGHAWHTEHIPAATGRTMSPFARSILGSLGPSAVIVKSDVELHVKTPDCWLYCLSSAFSKKAMRSIDETYDACVRIDYYHAFCSVIAGELIRQERILDSPEAAGIAWCVYGERRRPHQQHDTLAFALKAPRYRDQQEVRLVFFPAKRGQIEQDDLPLPPLRDLTDCCSLVPFEEIPDS
ncbi:MAG TPA: hypothetical protein VJX92_19025 [Methylomirabilota bacterium]|nr:hypothetical protein [Methylomirabilota bacterium]